MRLFQAAIPAAQLHADLIGEALRAWCPLVRRVGAEGVIATPWGESRFRREPLAGGVRFSLPDHPDAVQWSITGEPQGRTLLLHLTVARAVLEPQAVDRIEAFLDGWVEALVARYGASPLPAPATHPQPRLGVGAVVRRADAILLVQRRRPPWAGEWAIPGGRVRWGESLREAAEREILEETGVAIRAGGAVFHFELIDRDAHGAPLHHYVVIDLQGDYLGGEPKAGDDALEARWVPFDELDRLQVNAVTRRAVEEIFFKSGGTAALGGQGTRDNGSES